MSNDDFDFILQMLKNGQNPTASNSEAFGLSTSQRDGTVGTRYSNFGLHTVTEGADSDGSDK